MAVIIGIDPHKLLHAAYAIDEHEADLAHIEISADARQCDRLLAWAGSFETRSWAIESASGLGALLAQQLVDAGEHVVDVPATLSARVRLLGTGKSNKNDANDARAVAIAALRAPSLASVRAEDDATVLRMLTKAHLDAGRHRSQACARLHALVREMVAGGIRKDIVVSQAEMILEQIEPASLAAEQRLELAYELLDDVRRLDAKLKRSKQRIALAVAAADTCLMDIYGIGPIIAAGLIGYSGDVRRFPTAGHYAAYNGTAPIQIASALKSVHRLSRRGNRTLNHLTHMAAVTQIRHADTEGRRYYETKLEAGKTRREALRALKRKLSDRIYRALLADAER
jgi:transposase